MGFLGLGVTTTPPRRRAHPRGAPGHGMDVAILSGDSAKRTPRRRRAWLEPEAMAWELLPEQKLSSWCGCRQRGPVGRWWAMGSTMPCPGRRRSRHRGGGRAPRSPRHKGRSWRSWLMSSRAVSRGPRPGRAPMARAARSLAWAFVTNLADAAPRRRACSCPARPVLLSPPLARLAVAHQFDHGWCSQRPVPAWSPLDASPPGPVPWCSKHSTAVASRPPGLELPSPVAACQWAAPRRRPAVISQ